MRCCPHVIHAGCTIVLEAELGSHFAAHTLIRRDWFVAADVGSLQLIMGSVQLMFVSVQLMLGIRCS